MGVRAGIVLASIGLLFALVSTAFYIYMLSAISSQASGGGLAGALLAAAIAGLLFIFGYGGFILSTIFYLASYITSRHSRSKAIGILLIIGGMLFLASIAMVTATMLPRYRGPLEELALFAALLLAQAIIGLLCIAAGVRTARRSISIYHSWY